MPGLTPMSDLMHMRMARWLLEEMQRLTRRRYPDLTSSDLMAMGPGALLALRRFVEDVRDELHAANCLQLRALAEDAAASPDASR